MRLIYLIILIESAAILKNNAIISEFTIDNIGFSNIRQREGNWMFDTGHIQTITFTNATFNDVGSQDEGDETSGILHINTLDLNSQFDIEVSNIFISNSSANFISFGSIVNTSSVIKFFEIHNFTYIDSFIEANRKLLSTEDIKVKQNLVINFTLITFEKISFLKTGTLISFGHELSDNVFVVGLVITKIIAGKLHIESTNKQLIDVYTLVSIHDSVFDSIDDKYSSLIITGNGARLNVTNSSFTNIYTYEEGAVVYAGSTATQVNFHDVIFINNSAVTGALFHIEAESVVR